ncbi:indole-3-glycerol phosphate synthase TrpC [Alkalibacillus salilacus]|uniref:Indole-3-glycerol phosphate synthase n=1 Tax=Alkalibacillus salilacus TaxID=284582 RepID=A0ABT9VEE3_9BACI|nr:indole-3-glycerol phosphate synthase TrpC [Alkalibacillus salilacus]MDQ0159340.1 indole-3-glycerol phosphate synthase [Alkalibacillus salilacus]
MDTFLDRILDKKSEEIQLLYEQDALINQPLPVSTKPSLYETFKQDDQLSIIAEIKRASPSKGDINLGIEPPEQAQLYEASGASAISVLTDEPYFKGSIEDLNQVQSKVNLPVLCKDFILDPIQLKRAKQTGASVVLLIAAALSPERLQYLYDEAINLGLEVLLEVHNSAELNLALATGASIIGINNRDLTTFQVDLNTTETLINQIDDPDIVVISESGFKTSDDAKQVADMGVDGILVGESFMKSDNVSEALKEMRVPTTRRVQS